MDFTVLFHGPKNAAISAASLRKIPFEVLESYKNPETGKFETIGKVSGDAEFALKKWEKTGEVEQVNYQKMSLNPKQTKSRSPYKHKRLKSARAFDARSIRTVSRGGEKIRVGCPKGKYSPKKHRCKVGMRAQAILTPKKNPKEIFWVVYGQLESPGPGAYHKYYFTGTGHLNDNKNKAVIFQSEDQAKITAQALSHISKNSGLVFGISHALKKNRNEKMS